VLLGWVSVSLGWALVLPKIFLSADARGLRWAFRAAGMAVRVVVLGARVAKDLFDWGARGLGWVFHGGELGRYGGDARGCAARGIG